MVNLASFVKPITNTLKNVFTVKLKEIIIKPIEAFRDIIEDLINDLKTQILNVFKVITVPIKFIVKAISSIGKIFKSLFKQLIGVFKPIIKMFSNMFSQIFKIFTTVFKSLVKIMNSMVKKAMKVIGIVVKFLKAIFKKIVAFFKKLFEQIKKIFETIFFYIMCVWNKIMSLDECIVYYIMDCLIWLLLLPYRMMFWMFPQLAELEDLVNDTVELIDGIVYDTSSALRGKDENGNIRAGFHINQWPNGILNKCYRCKPKTPEAKEGLFLKELEEFFNDDGTNFFKFLFRCTLIIFATITVGIYGYRFFTKNESCTQRK